MLCTYPDTSLLQHLTVLQVVVALVRGKRIVELDGRLQYTQQETSLSGEKFDRTQKAEADDDGRSDENTMYPCWMDIDVLSPR